MYVLVAETACTTYHTISYTMCIKFTKVNNCQVPGHYQINSIGKINQFEVHCALHCPKSLGATFEEKKSTKKAGESFCSLNMWAFKKH